jgi:hypothetical protein
LTTGAGVVGVVVQEVLQQPPATADLASSLRLIFCIVEVPFSDWNKLARKQFPATSNTILTLEIIELPRLALF